MRVSARTPPLRCSVQSSQRSHLGTLRRRMQACTLERRSLKLSTLNRLPLGEEGRDQVTREVASDKDPGTVSALMSSIVSVLGASVLSAGLLLASPASASIKPPKIELFEPMRYVGRWYEVASLKRGFAGEGQQDCHCTQGVYVPIKNAKDQIRLEVNTFCFHGGPKGRLSGIRGDVTCANPRDLYLLPEFETDFEKKEQIREKCILRFPQIPFIPPEPYDVIRTDYDTYAIVQGAADTSFVQIYSRTPNPGKAFIEKQKDFLRQYGYPVDDIRETPQDCEVIPTDKLTQMMGDKMMGAVLTNTLPSAEAEVETGVRFEGPRNLLRTIQDLLTVFQQNE